MVPARFDWRPSRCWRGVTWTLPPRRGCWRYAPPNHIRRSPQAPRIPLAAARTAKSKTEVAVKLPANKVTLDQAAVFNDTLDVTGKIAAQPKLLCGGWEQSGYALDGCVDTGLLRPPQAHSSQLGTVYATKRRRRNGKRLV
ncbi:hypothetical protein ACJJTC_017138 [Scirpophaga incertulas]